MRAKSVWPPVTREDEQKMNGYRRHPAEVTSDRLADALDKWPDSFEPQDRDAVARLRFVLENIADAAIERS